MLVVTMLGVAATFKCVIDELTYGTNVQLVGLLQVENENNTDTDLNTSFHEVENCSNICTLPYDT